MITSRPTTFSNSTTVNLTPKSSHWLLNSHLRIGQDLDAMYQGNKTRFINSSSDELNRNCEPALLLCKTETRIGMYALRDIQPGEELFFDYRYVLNNTEMR